MELVEGPTLAEHTEGALSTDEALSIAKQIAEALAAAHEQGMVGCGSNVNWMAWRAAFADVDRLTRSKSASPVKGR
jgi:serine/threonine protein kinase